MRQELRLLRALGCIAGMFGKLPHVEAEWFAKCIELEEHFDYFFSQGMVQFFLQERERIVRLAEMEADIMYLENPDGSRTSLMRDKLLQAEMLLAETLH